MKNWLLTRLFVGAKLVLTPINFSRFMPLSAKSIVFSFFLFTTTVHADDERNSTGWAPADLALALETVEYGSKFCPIYLPEGTMAVYLLGWGEALGIGGAALTALMHQKEPTVRQMAELYAHGFCWQAKAIAAQFGMTSNSQ